MRIIIKSSCCYRNHIPDNAVGYVALLHLNYQRRDIVQSLRTQTTPLPQILAFLSGNTAPSIPAVSFKPARFCHLPQLPVLLSTAVSPAPSVSSMPGTAHTDRRLARDQVSLEQPSELAPRQDRPGPAPQPRPRPAATTGYAFLNPIAQAGPIGALVPAAIIREERENRENALGPRSRWRFVAGLALPVNAAALSNGGRMDAAGSPTGLRRSQVGSLDSGAPAPDHGFVGAWRGKPKLVSPEWDVEQALRDGARSYKR